MTTAASTVPANEGPPSPLPWQRPGPTPAQRRVDLYVGLAAVAASLLSITLNNSAGAFALGRPPSWPEQVAWSVATAVPIIWRRRYPEATLIAVGAFFIGGQIRSTTDVLVPSVLLFGAVYTVGAWGRDRRRAAIVRTAVIVAMFSWLAVSIWWHMFRVGFTPAPQAAGPLPPLLAALISGVLFNLAFFAFAYVAGETAWTSARRLHELRVQAEQLRRSRATVAEQAVVGERVRIARELHDVVAHHVSVMGVQAGAARRVLDRDPARAKQALSAVEETARTAVDELRRMLGVLRAPGREPVTAEPPALADRGIDQVETLLQRARDAGLQVRYGVFGDPVPVPGSLSLAAYRVVQEALTNTLRHAAASSVDVRVRYLAQELEIDIADDGRARRSAPVAAGQDGPGGPVDDRPPGMGLIGMRERVAAHGGVVEAGLRPERGFRVRARFPLPGAPSQAPSSGHGEQATRGERDAGHREQASA